MPDPADLVVTSDNVDLTKYKPAPSSDIPDAPHHNAGGVARVAVDDHLMNFEVGGRRYSTRDGGTTMPRQDAEALIRAGVPGVKILPVSSSGFGPGERVNGQARHLYFPGDCSCEECKNDHP